MVQTAEAQLTASFASLTPTPSEIPSATQTLSVSAERTLRVSTASPTDSPTLGTTPTPMLSTPTPTPTHTLRVFGTPTVSPTPRLSTATPRLTLTLGVFAERTPRVSPTPTASPIPTASPTPTATQGPPVPLSPANAMSVTQAAILGPVIVTGTRVAKLDEVAFAPDGQLAAAGSGGLLFDQAGVLTVTQGFTLTTWVTALDFSPDGASLAAGTVEGIVRIFNRVRGAILLQLVQPGTTVDRVRYRPGPGGGLQFVATLGSDNRVYLWDVLQPRSLGTLDTGLAGGHMLEFSGDGSWLAVASGSEVRIWPVDSLTAGQALSPGTTPAPALTLPQDGVVTSLAFSRDGYLLAAGNATGTIELWYLPGGEHAGSLAQLGAPAQHLAFSPSGQLLASSHGDRRIHLWALAGATNQPLASLTGHTDAITSLAFSPDGATLASSSWDGTVRLWEIP